MKIPLAERFHSVQGEGYWCGSAMHFVRLPGCSVGKIGTSITISNDYGGLDDINPPTLPGIEKKPAWLCHAFDGTPFWCDTDFHRYLEEEGEAILADTWEKHLCLTGGEPLMHRKVVDWFRTQCQLRDIRLHIETSGTIDFWWEAELHSPNDPRDPWLTVSPKQGWTPYMIHFANEVKLLVSRDFDARKLDAAFLNHNRVYLSPINNIGSGGLYHPDSTEARDRCLELLRSHPNWRLSVQLHKYLNVR